MQPAADLCSCLSIALQAACRLHPDMEGCFELSIGNADKGLLPLEEIRRRVAQFTQTGLPLVVTQVGGVEQGWAAGGMCVCALCVCARTCVWWTFTQAGLPPGVHTSEWRRRGLDSGSGRAMPRQRRGR